MSTKPPAAVALDKAVFFAVFVADPEKLKAATGEDQSAGALFSYGTAIADAKTLADRGLAVQGFNSEADLTLQVWDQMQKAFVAAPVPPQDQRKAAIDALIAKDPATFTQADRDAINQLQLALLAELRG